MSGSFADHIPKNNLANIDSRDLVYNAPERGMHDTAQIHAPISCHILKDLASSSTSSRLECPRYIGAPVKYRRLIRPPIQVDGRQVVAYHSGQNKPKATAAASVSSARSGRRSWRGNCAWLD